MRQKMRKNDPYCCLTLMKYLILHLSTLKELKNAKKVKGNRPTDRQTDRPTDRHSDLQSRVHATKKNEGRIYSCFFFCHLYNLVTDKNHSNENEVTFKFVNHTVFSGKAPSPYHAPPLFAIVNYKEMTEKFEIFRKQGRSP